MLDSGTDDLLPFLEQTIGRAILGASALVIFILGMLAGRAI